jgi:hypothetical protein
VPIPMSRTADLLLFVGFLALSSTGALAQAVDKPIEKTPSDDRFIYEQVEEGILRLDSRTGEVSLCGRQDNGWACRIVADERGALNVEIERLERENSELRKQLADRTLPTGSASALVASAPAAAPNVIAEPAPAAPKAAAVPEKPAEKQANSRASTDAHLVVVNRTVEIADKIWRRLVEMMANVKSDLRKNS